jgi:tetratricopeptide (TPR) repeat protein
MRRPLILSILSLLSATVVVADWSAGIQAYNKKDYATALKEFQGVIQSNPEYGGAYYMAGKCNEALGRQGDALKMYEQANKLDPADPRTAVSLAGLYIVRGEGKQAASVLDGVKLDALQSQAKAVVLTLKAQAAIAQGGYQSATDLARQATQADNGSADAWATLGLAYSNSNKPADAFSAFKRGCDLSGDVAVCKNAVAAGITAAQLEQSRTRRQQLYDQTAAVATKLAQAKGGSEGALLAGEALLGAQDFDGAMSGFENALVTYYKGQCYIGKKTWPQAERLLRDALMKSPDTDLRRKIYTSLGYVYDEMHRYPEAAQAYTEAGNTTKVAEMNEKQKKMEQNKKAEEEQRRYEELKKLQEQYKNITGGGGPAPTPTPPK